MYKIWHYLIFVVFSCKSPWNTAAVSFHIFQEHQCLTLLSAMNLAFFLAIWQLIEVWLASHSLQSVHCVGSSTMSCMFCKCVDVHFERLLIVSGRLHSTLSRLYWIWVWIQKEEESTCFASDGSFPLKLCDIEWVAKLALKGGRYKLVTKYWVLGP